MLRYTVRFVSIYRNKRALWSKSKILVFCQLYIYIYIYILYIYIYIYIYIYTDTKDRYEERSVLPGEHLRYTPHPTPLSTLPWQQQLQFLRFSALPGDSTDWPPHYHSEAKAGNGMQLYILYSFIYIYIYLLSLYELCHFGVEQVNRSVMHLFLCQIFMDFIMLLLLLLLCISPQHIYVVIVVVYYTSGTITTK